MRRISLDPATVEVLTEHRQWYDELVRKVGLEPTDEAFLLSYEFAHGRAYDPSESSHPHTLGRHSATELLTAGVDLRTVAGRLGHGGGGATTLRVYAAWVGESDRRAGGCIARSARGR